ncbi:hypothetical protein Y1Q_0015569 [Alligator mississippiensis]|uniref:Uncharacterized protein n=1 Tax=Alligator mississippiensis TaxID=8496 RepID=A0A151NPB6_ALLMI|nr:hypothetical protein Y1Q_0015569 [Alligator mississippiensis]
MQAKEIQRRELGLEDCDRLHSGCHVEAPECKVEKPMKLLGNLKTGKREVPVIRNQHQAEQCTPINTLSQSPNKILVLDQACSIPDNYKSFST